MTCHFVLPFSVRWRGDEGTTQVLRRQKDLKRENVRSLNDAQKGYVETWNQ